MVEAPIIVASQAAHLSTPAQHEEIRCAGGLRAGVLHAQSQSPGRGGAFCRRQPFSRRQAVGVVAYLNTGTLTAVNFSGRMAARRLFSSLVNCVQQPTSGLSKLFPSPFFVLAHVEQHSKGLFAACAKNQSHRSTK